MDSNSQVPRQPVTPTTGRRRRMARPWIKRATAVIVALTGLVTALVALVAACSALFRALA